jgi:YggT family protein
MLANIVKLLFLIYTLMIFVRIMGSWIESLRETTFMRFVAHYTDPYLDIFRKVIPPIGGTIDISPILAFFVLDLLKKIILSFIR